MRPYPITTLWLELGSSCCCAGDYCDRNHRAGNAFQNTTTDHFQKTLPTSALEVSVGSELHTPLPLSLGAELILEEAFTPNCRHAEGGTFLLEDENALLSEKAKVRNPLARKDVGHATLL